MYNIMFLLLFSTLQSIALGQNKLFSLLPANLINCDFRVCSALFSFFGLDLGWIQRHQDQLQRFTTTSFLEGMLTHLRKVDVLSSAEETKIKEAGQLQDQVNMLTTIVTSKDTQSSDALQGFIESSDSQVAQLIINHGKGLIRGFALCHSFF